MSHPLLLLTLLLLFGSGLAAAPATTAKDDALVWSAERNRVDAEIQAQPLPRLLEQIAGATGWQIYVEPNTAHTVSAKFQNLPPGEALRLLLGKLNFALVPQDGGQPRLYVFRTSLGDATQLIRPAGRPDSTRSGRAIPNELIVSLKPDAGISIEDLARQLRARVTGRLDAFNAYRLEFDDETAAGNARRALETNPDVAGVESNYHMDRPPQPESVLAASGTPPLTLKPKSNPDGSRLVIGLIDTAVQSLGGQFAAFFLPAISAAGEAVTPAHAPAHGTSMAETILRGIDITGSGGSAVKLLPVDVYGADASANTFNVSKGIFLAVNGGATLVNLSLGTTADSQILHNVIQTASAQGVLFLAAAGNQPVATPTYPAAYPEVLAVTAGDRKGNIAGYANYGPFVDIVAPGATIVHYNGQSFYVSGTSTATAFATGLAASQAEQTGMALRDVETRLRQNLAVKSSPLP